MRLSAQDNPRPPKYPIAKDDQLKKSGFSTVSPISTVFELSLTYYCLLPRLFLRENTKE